MESMCAMVWSTSSVSRYSRGERARGELACAYEFINRKGELSAELVTVIRENLGRASPHRDVLLNQYTSRAFGRKSALETTCIAASRLNLSINREIQLFPRAVVGGGPK